MDYSRFHEQLFPGVPIMRENPLPGAVWDDAPAEAILAEVSCQTGVPVRWLQKSVREVLDGMSGLGCLWFLHGAQGRVSGSLAIPSEVGLPMQNLQRDVGLTATKKARDQGKQVNIQYSVDWGQGTVEEETNWYTKGRRTSRTIRLGKWLKRQGKAWPEEIYRDVLHAFETRVLPEWDFVVSCTPYDVLTMSHGRPWPSCMKPGGMFEYGPLTDMAAGSAIVWFFRPGADEPAGRLILRPFLDYDPNTDAEDSPTIATGGRLYGSGPDTSTDALNTMLEPWLQGLHITLVNICPRGRRGLALTRGIYSDTDRVAGGCQQDLHEYAEAYRYLGDSPWPTPKFDLGEIAKEAEAQAAGYEYRPKYDEDDEDDQFSLREANQNLLSSGREGILDWYLVPDGDGPSTSDCYIAVQDESVLREAIVQYVDSLLEGGNYSAFAQYNEEPDPEIYDDLYDVLYHGLVGYIREQTTFLTVMTVTPERMSAFHKGLLAIGSPDLLSAYNLLIHAYTPLELADAEDYNAVEQTWYKLFDADELLNQFNLDETDEGYVDDDTDDLIAGVFLMPDWFHDDFVHDTGASFVGYVNVKEVAYLTPDPLAWLKALEAT